ncbi:MAG: hypothetical protein V7607_2519 [Solirubrobacteraceae bacterium]
MSVTADPDAPVAVGQTVRSEDHLGGGVIAHVREILGPIGRVDDHRAARTAVRPWSACVITGCLEPVDLLAARSPSPASVAIEP